MQKYKTSTQSFCVDDFFVKKVMCWRHKLSITPHAMWELLISRIMCPEGTRLLLVLAQGSVVFNGLQKSVMQLFYQTFG